MLLTTWPSTCSQDEASRHKHYGHAVLHVKMHNCLFRIHMLTR